MSARSKPREDQPTLFAAAGHAKTSAWLESVLDWLASDPDCSPSSFVSLTRSLPAGFSERTSLACFPRKAEETSTPSSRRWCNAGMAWPGGCLTLNTSEFPSDGGASSLSAVLETQPVPQRYFLSQKAALGILRRAERRGKKLPAHLEAALRDVAGLTIPTDAESS